MRICANLHEGCSQWKYEWSHEQRAFSEYIRYDFNKTPETIVALPCNDAVGWPGFRDEVLSQSTLDDDISDCNGTMFRHYTKDKSLVKDTGASSVMQILSAVIQQHKAWTRHLGSIDPYYSVGCNPDPLVIKTLHALGCGFHCVVEAETRLVLSLGVPA